MSGVAKSRTAQTHSHREDQVQCYWVDVNEDTTIIKMSSKRSVCVCMCCNAPAHQINVLLSSVMLNRMYRRFPMNFNCALRD